MRQQRRAAAVLVCVLVGGRAAAGAVEQVPQPSAAHRQALALLDANGDGVVDRAELATFARPRIAALLRTTGASVDESAAAYQLFLDSQLDSLLNASSSDGNDTISLAEMGRLSAASLIEPLGGTFAQLLPPPPDAPAASEPWTDRLARFVQIRRSFLDEASIGKPASVSLVTQASNDETVEPGDPRRVFTIKSAISLRRAKEWKAGQWYSRPIAAYEVNVVSNTPENDEIVHRVGLTGAYLRKDAASPFSSSVFLLTLDYRTDRGYDAQVWGGTFQYTFFYRAIGIGQYRPRRGAVAFRWQPYVGVVFADVRKAGGVTAYQDMSDYTHWFAKVAAEAKLGSNWLITPEVVSWKGTRVDADGQEHDWQGYYSLANRWVLARSNGAERASIQLTGTVGRNSPAFQFEKAMEIALGFKF